MVKHNTAALDTTFSALSDPTRRAILSRLAQSPASVTEIAAPFDISLAAVSKHLRVLEEAGLLTRRVDGRVHTCHLNTAPLRDATVWLTTYRRFWEARLDSLAEFLDTTTLEDASVGDVSPKDAT